MHDLRHTCAVRMLRDGNLSLRDAQVIQGHAHLSTTEVYLVEDDNVVIDRVRRHHTDRQDRTDRRPDPPPVILGYNPADLEVLFGKGSTGERDRCHDAGQRGEPMAAGPGRAGPHPGARTPARTA